LFVTAFLGLGTQDKDILRDWFRPGLPVIRDCLEQIDARARESGCRDRAADRAGYDLELRAFGKADNVMTSDNLIFLEGPHHDRSFEQVWILVYGLKRWDLVYSSLFHCE
jgi:hypothetical protein